MNKSETNVSPQSADLTSYDFLKAFAVVVMVIDHMGLLIYPNEQWFRAIGRIGFPIWFFLVGHASGRGIPSKLLYGAIILQLFYAATYGIDTQRMLLLNALFSIIIIRLTIDKIVKFCMVSQWNLWAMCIFLFVLYYPSSLLFEYGTLAILTALFGYFVRHKESLKEHYSNDYIVLMVMLFAYVSFIFYMQHSFHFGVAEFTFMALGTFCVRYYLYKKFDKTSYPDTTKRIGKPGVSILKGMGRYTLEIYIIHLMILVSIAYFSAQ